MEIYNATRNTVLAGDCKVADTFVSRFMGLMEKNSLPHNSGLLIHPCKSIHMFFMKISLDVVFIDKKNTVVYLLEGIKPWHISKVIRKASCVLELPTGTINRSKTHLGDNLEFKQIIR